MELVLVEFDARRQKAQSSMQLGGDSTGAFVASLCAQNASPSKSEKSLELASFLGNVNLSRVAGQTRRLFGSCGGAARQDFLVAADEDLSSEVESDHATR